MDEASIIKEIAQYIKGNILAAEVEIGDDTLLQNVGVDSFSTVEIILYLERQYGVVIPDEKLVPENFKTLRSLAAIVLELSPKAKS